MHTTILGSSVCHISNLRHSNTCVSVVHSNTKGENPSKFYLYSYLKKISDKLLKSTKNSWIKQRYKDKNSETRRALCQNINTIMA